ncbi:MAG: NADH-quinone oxidoreductase subunit I [Deltaproteobacteria bacterium]|nr:NADH-quinone oxidoreductase subunit I [Deltaproteobacteria bacterium]
MTVKVKVLERPELGLAERGYLGGLLQGMAATNRHFFRNWIRRKETVTLEYPEETRPYPSRWRGLHRLMHREDGSVRCVACMMCSTHCPANCITIVAGEHEDPSIEKYPVSFEIDLLLCIYCGFCEEACPCDAIRLDTGTHAKPACSRDEIRTSRQDLLSRGALSIAKQGGRSL